MLWRSTPWPLPRSRPCPPCRRRRRRCRRRPRSRRRPPCQPSPPSQPPPPCQPPPSPPSPPPSPLPPRGEWVSSERYTTAALWALYEHTGGASWVNNTGWLGNTEPCGALGDDGLLDNSSAWFGVSECVHEGSRLHPRVSKLELSRNGLSGELPIELDLLGESNPPSPTNALCTRRKSCPPGPPRFLAASPPTRSSLRSSLREPCAPSPVPHSDSAASFGRLAAQGAPSV
jgi:hypothetical protein